MQISLSPRRISETSAIVAWAPGDALHPDSQVARAISPVDTLQERARAPLPGPPSSVLMCFHSNGLNRPEPSRSTDDRAGVPVHRPPSRAEGNIRPIEPVNLVRGAARDALGPSGNQLYPAADGGVRPDATVVRPPRPERTCKVSFTLSDARAGRSRCWRGAGAFARHRRHSRLQALSQQWLDSALNCGTAGAPDAQSGRFASEGPSSSFVSCSASRSSAKSVS